MLARQTPAASDYLVEHVTPLDPAYQARIDHLSALLMQKGHAAGEALRMAEGLVYHAVQTHATMLAYLDDFRLLAVVFFLLPRRSFCSGRRRRSGRPRRRTDMANSTFGDRSRRI